MAVDPGLLELMVSDVAWKQKSGQDLWQNPLYSDPVPIRAYALDEVHTVEDEQGNKRVAAGTVYTADVYGIEIGDVLIVNGRPLGEIIRVRNWVDENGPYGSEIHHG